jgi:hypothetical protein
MSHLARNLAFWVFLALALVLLFQIGHHHA